MDVITLNCSFESVLMLGITQGIFALVRFNFAILGKLKVNQALKYDLSVIFAGIMNVPIAFGIFGLFVAILCV